MDYVSVDLHKKTITICVVDEARKVLFRKMIPCDRMDLIE